MTLFLILFAFLIISIVTAFIVIINIGPLILLQPQRHSIAYYRQITSVLTPYDLDMNYEEIVLISKDGLPLSGWFIPSRARTTGGTIILCHGVGDCKIAEIPLAKIFYDVDFHVGLFDARRHGESGGNYCTYGYYEKYDVQTIIDYLKSSKGERLGKIGIVGFSRGAAVALQAAALDHRIGAVAAEACFTDLRTIALDYQKRLIKIGWKMIRDVVIRKSERMANFVADEVSPLEAVKSQHIPLLFIHGKKDTLIKWEHSEILYRHANEPKELYLIENARHNDTWVVGGKEYERKLIEFFAKALS